ncbi:relaxase domain-containing protein, partial [Escherichia coli]|uniref:relaxase domain-containing protein n=1 Tax=Escherichia coli TaxID=562 RepID=UPI00207720C9
EVENGARPVKTVKSAVIGLIGTAPMGDVNTLVQCLSEKDAAAFGRLYREKLKEQVEALGYETEVVGKHGMWEMPGVPVEAFSG